MTNYTDYPDQSIPTYRYLVCSYRILRTLVPTGALTHLSFYCGVTTDPMGIYHLPLKVRM